MRVGSLSTFPFHVRMPSTSCCFCTRTYTHTTNVVLSAAEQRPGNGLSGAYIRRSCDEKIVILRRVILVRPRLAVDARPKTCHRIGIMRVRWRYSCACVCVQPGSDAPYFGSSSQSFDKFGSLYLRNLPVHIRTPRRAASVVAPMRRSEDSIASLALQGVRSALWRLRL